MLLFWQIIRKTFTDLWEESFLLVLANILWVVGAVPGLALISMGIINLFLPFLVLGLVVLFPLPYVTFGLFFLAHQVGQRRAISFKTFFIGGKRLWKQAYLWGGVNTLVIIILLGNVKFYTNPASPLGNTPSGAALAGIFGAFTLLWLAWQLFTLPIYLRLEKPGLRAAFHQSGILLLTKPILCLLVALVASALALSAFFLPALGLLTNFILIALLANRTMIEVLKED